MIENVTLLSGSSCDSYVQGLNETVGSGWLCLSKPISLLNNGKFGKSSLGVRLAFPTAFGFTSAFI